MLQRLSILNYILLFCRRQVIFVFNLPFTFCFEIGEMISKKLLHSQNGRTCTKLTIKGGVLLKVNAKQGLLGTLLTAKFTTSVSISQLGWSWKIQNTCFTYPQQRAWNCVTGSTLFPIHRIITQHRDRVPLELMGVLSILHSCTMVTSVVSKCR